MIFGNLGQVAFVTVCVFCKNPVSGCVHWTHVAGSGWKDPRSRFPLLNGVGPRSARMRPGGVWTNVHPDETPKEKIIEYLRRLRKVRC